MKNPFSIIICLIFATFFSLFRYPVQAQSFKKGELLVSATDGISPVNYTTTESGHNDGVYHTHTQGNGYNISAEYGLSKRLGIGISLTRDVYEIPGANYVDPGEENYYKYNMTDIDFFSPSHSDIKSTANQYTVEASYHYLMAKKWDLSAYAGAGLATVAITGVTSMKQNYDYHAIGGVAKVGSKVRYCITKRVGVSWTLSAFALDASPEAGKCNYGSAVNEGSAFTTKISGFSTELGLTVRFF